MADLVITAANVSQSTGTAAALKTVLAAVGISAGQQCYINSGGQAALGIATSAAAATWYGIAISSAAAGQPVTLQRSQAINLGSGVGVVGVIYCVSHANAGGIAPSTDLASSGYYVSPLGVMTASGILTLFTGVPTPVAHA
jgi:hypothetical protein